MNLVFHSNFQTILCCLNHSTFSGKHCLHSKIYKYLCFQLTHFYASINIPYDFQVVVVVEKKTFGMKQSEGHHSSLSYSVVLNHPYIKHLIYFHLHFTSIIYCSDHIQQVAVNSICSKSANAHFLFYIHAFLSGLLKSNNRVFASPTWHESTLHSLILFIVTLCNFSNIILPNIFPVILKLTMLMVSARDLNSGTSPC